MSTPDPGIAAPDTITEGLVDAMVQASFVVMGVLTRIAADHDVSLTQLRVLAILRDRSPGVSALAEHLGLERSTMSGLVDRAEKRGLIRRTPDPDDGRAVRITATAEGAALAATGYRQVAAALAPALERVAPADQGRLQALLAQLLGGAAA